MMSTNDISILAAICSIPGMSEETIRNLLNQIEDAEVVTICEIILGRKPIADVALETQKKARSVQQWAKVKQTRIYNEQISARRRQQTTEMARSMKERYRQGLISKEALLLYGISGPLPVRHPIQRRRLTTTESRAIYTRRVEIRLGSQCVKMLSPNPNLNWATDGF